MSFIVTLIELFQEYLCEHVYCQDIVAGSRDVEQNKYLYSVVFFCTNTYELSDIDRIGQTFGFQVIKC